MARSRDIYRVVAARFLSRAGSEAAFFVGIWGKAAFVMGATPAQLAVIMFAVSIAAILGSIVSGVMVDRYGPRRTLIFGELLFVPAALAIAFANTLPQLTVIVGLWALAGSPVVTASASFAPYLVTSGGRLERMNAWIEGAGSAAFVAGPAVGALIVRYGNVNWVFIIDAVTSLIAAVLVSRVALTAPHHDKAEERHPFAELTEGLRTVYSLRTVRYYVLAGSVVWMAFGAFGALEPLFFRDVAKTGIEQMGWMNSIFGLGFVVGAILLPRLPRKIISARGLAIMLGLTGLGTVAYVGSPDLRIIAVGAFGWATVIGILEPLLRTLIQRDSPHTLVGRVMGTSEVHRRMGELLPLAIAPTLAARFGVQAVLIGGGLAATVIGVLSFGEAAAIDRDVTLRGVPNVKPEGLRSADEPISPNP